jgi:hypothetical protein
MMRAHVVVSMKVRADVLAIIRNPHIKGANGPLNVTIVSSSIAYLNIPTIGMTAVLTIIE